MTQIATIILVSLLLLGGYGCQTTPGRESDEYDEYIELAATKAVAMTLVLRCQKSARELNRKHEQLKRENKQLKHILDSHYEDFNRERGME